MQSFEDRLKKHFGNTLAEGEELYTKENLKAINQIKGLFSEDLSFILHQIILLDLKARLTTEGQKRLDDFFNELDQDKYHNDQFFESFSEIINDGLSLFLFAAKGKIERLTRTSHYSKWTTPDLHKEYLEENPQLRAIFEKSCKAEKLNELLKDSSENFREPYMKPRPTSDYINFIDQASDKGQD